MANEVSSNLLSEESRRLLSIAIDSSQVVTVVKLEE